MRTLKAFLLSGPHRLPVSAHYTHYGLPVLGIVMRFSHTLAKGGEDQPMPPATLSLRHQLPMCSGPAVSIVPLQGQRQQHRAKSRAAGWRLRTSL